MQYTEREDGSLDDADRYFHAWFHCLSEHIEHDIDRYNAANYWVCVYTGGGGEGMCQELIRQICTFITTPWYLRCLVCRLSASLTLYANETPLWRSD